MFLHGRAAAEGDPQRLRALSPYLERLRDWTGAGSGEPAVAERAARIRVGRHSVSLGPWERTRIRAALAGSSASAEPWNELIAQGAALLTKSMVDIDRMQQNPHLPLQSLYGLQAELMLDTAIGMALLSEVQDTIDAFVFLGKVDQAKRISEFRHKVGHMVQEVRKLLSESERAQAATLSEEMAVHPEADSEGAESPLERLSRKIDASTAPPAETGDGQGPATPVEEPSAAAPVLRDEAALSLPGDPRRPETRGGMPGRTRALAALFAMLAAVWVGAVYLPAQIRDEPVRLTPYSTARPELFERVEPRHPSLFVTVVSKRWDALRPYERAAAVEEISRLSTELGFEGAYLHTAEGRPVARWLSRRGPTLIDEGGRLP